MKYATLAFTTLAAVGLAAAAQAQTAASPIPRGIASSFNPTAEQALARQAIHDAGYAGVTSLERAPDGAWHAQAYRDNAYRSVTVDRTGHVSQQ